MGMTIIQFFHKRIKSTWKTAFLSAFFVGLATHLFKFTNTLLTHDSLYFVYSKMNSLSSGRWLLQFASGISSYFDLPWFIGLLSLIWISLTAVIITELFEVKNSFVSFLIGGILVVFPCVTNTFIYQFTADGYFLSMMLAALAAYFSKVGDRKHWHFALSSLLLCLSLGIYQSYISFALLLSLCHFILALLQNTHSRKEYWRWIFLQILVYLLAAVFYLIIWKSLMRIQNISAADYAGIASLGSAGTAFRFPSAFIKTFTTLGRFFLGGNVVKNGWSLYAILNIVFLLLLFLVFIIALRKTLVYHSLERFLLICISVIAIPVAACIWYFASVEVEYHMLMLQSLSILYIFAIVLFDRFTVSKISTYVGLFFLLIIFKFSLQANICYFEMEKCMEHTQANAIEMLTRIHLLDEGQVEQIAFIGGGDRSLVNDHSAGINEILVHADQLRSTLLFDHQYSSLYLKKILGTEYTVMSDLGVNERTEAFLNTMGEWPAADSIIIDGDTAIIRLPSSN